MTHTYNRQTAIDHCSALEAHLAPIGVHVALGGSILYRGHSEHDYDIMLYPHNNGEQVPRERVKVLLETLGYVRTSVSMKGSAGLPDVLVTENEGIRFDFFFLAR